MAGLSERLYQRDAFRRRVAKRQLLEGRAQSNLFAAKLKEMSRGNYIQSLTPFQPKTVTIAKKERKRRPQLHTLRRRALARKTLSGRFTQRGASEAYVSRMRGRATSTPYQFRYRSALFPGRGLSRRRRGTIMSILNRGRKVLV